MSSQVADRPRILNPLLRDWRARRRMSQPTSRSRRACRPATSLHRDRAREAERRHGRSNCRAPRGPAPRPQHAAPRRRLRARLCRRPPPLARDGAGLRRHLPGAARATSRIRPAAGPPLGPPAANCGGRRCPSRARRAPPLEPPVNVLRDSLHPLSMASRIVEPRRVARAPARPPRPPGRRERRPGSPRVSRRARRVSGGAPGHAPGLKAGAHRGPLRLATDAGEVRADQHRDDVQDGHGRHRLRALRSSRSSRRTTQRPVLYIAATAIVASAIFCATLLLEGNPHPPLYAGHLPGDADSKAADLHAQPPATTTNPIHSSFGFAVRYQGVSIFRGTLDGVQATLADGASRARQVESISIRTPGAVPRPRPERRVLRRRQPPRGHLRVDRARPQRGRHRRASRATSRSRASRSRSRPPARGPRRPPTRSATPAGTSTSRPSSTAPSRT